MRRWTDTMEIILVIICKNRSTARCSNPGVFISCNSNLPKLCLAAGFKLFFFLSVPRLADSIIVNYKTLCGHILIRKLLLHSYIVTLPFFLCFWNKRWFFFSKRVIVILQHPLCSAYNIILQLEKNIHNGSEWLMLIPHIHYSRAWASCSSVLPGCPTLVLGLCL